MSATEALLSSEMLHGSVVFEPLNTSFICWLVFSYCLCGFWVWP